MQLLHYSKKFIHFYNNKRTNEHFISTLIVLDFPLNWNSTRVIFMERLSKMNHRAGNANDKDEPR